MIKRVDQLKPGDRLAGQVPPGEGRQRANYRLLGNFPVGEIIEVLGPALRGKPGVAIEKLVALVISDGETSNGVARKWYCDRLVEVEGSDSPRMVVSV